MAVQFSKAYAFPLKILQIIQFKAPLFYILFKRVLATALSGASLIFFSAKLANHFSKTRSVVTLGCPIAMAVPLSRATLSTSLRRRTISSSLSMSSKNTSRDTTGTLSLSQVGQQASLTSLENLEKVAQNSLSALIQLTLLGSRP